MQETQPMVSIICNTYNHEKYISEAIDSFLMQQTSFPYEILINDDASTDNTTAIVREYSEKYPEIIKPLFHKENQDSKGKDASLDFQIPRSKGKYIAICEGDDYWTDPHKLQTQYDLMEKHTELDICAHAVKEVVAETKKEIGIISPSDKTIIFSVEEVIMGGGGFVGTNSLFYRNQINRTIPQFRRDFPYDYATQIHGSLRGGMLYFPECMSSYRTMAPGSWTHRQKGSKERKKHEDDLKKMFVQLDEYTDRRYHEIIENRRIKRDFVHMHSDKKYAQMLDPKYKELLKSLKPSSRIKIIILGNFERIIGQIKRK